MPLTDDQMRRLGTLLDEALLLPAAQRRAWLEALPPQEQPLFTQLRAALLDGSDNGASDQWLEAPPALAPGESTATGIGRRAGERLGTYELQRPLGAGGMAEVWLARRADGVFERQVALKIPRLLHLSPGMAERFARECQILASLESPGIARLYDAGIDTGGIPYIAMEYVQGEPLVEWCRTQALDIPARLRVFLKVLDAVGQAHAQQVIHRDLKPSNILVTAAGEPRLLDFGVARLLQPDTEGASLTHVYGRALTPAYASPEMLRGEPIDLRSDIYSLGVVLHELLTGTRPGTRTLMDAQSTGGLVAGLRTVLAKALAQAPADRFADAAEFASALQPFALGGRLGHGLAAPRRYLLAASLAAVAVAAVLVAVLVYRGRGVEQATPAGLVRAPVSLAVMPFTNLSSDPEQEFFSDGLAEEILNQLSQFQGLDVRARTSSFAFKGRQEDVATIGRQLDVAYLLQGSVRKADRKVRITAQLVHVTEASQVWSKTYDGELQDVFALQEEVARDVGTALSVKLDVGDLSRASGGTTNLAAYEKFLQARSELARLDGGNADRAVTLLHEALDLDPGFGVAWVLLAQTLYGLPGTHGPVETERELAQIVAYNVRVAPTAPWTKHLQAYDHFAHYRWAEAEAAAVAVGSTPYGSRRIVDGFGNPPIDLKWLRLFQPGRVAEAFQLTDAWARTDPLNLYASTVKVRLLPYVDRSGEQAAEYERSQSLEGSHSTIQYAVLLKLLRTEGSDSAAARKQFAMVTSGRPASSIYRRVFDRLDDPVAAIIVLRAALDDPATNLQHLAQMADAFGDRDLALAALSKAALHPAWREPFGLGYGLWYPYRTGLRTDPRFKSLLREIGLAQYWRATGNWGDFCRPVGTDDFECR